MKSLLYYSLLVLLPSANPGKPDLVDPTGTYILTGKVKNNRVVSHSGEIRVELLAQDRLVLCLYINKGFPNYESASLIDTLGYDENIARYAPSAGPACAVLFKFDAKTAEIIQVYSNPRSDCGVFAYGALASSVFRKTSSVKPVIQDLSFRGAGLKQ